jgi:hypothetical protein
MRLQDNEGMNERVQLEVDDPRRISVHFALRHLKIQNGYQRRSKFALKPYGKQHFHLLLENSRTEFNQTWQRCFLWGPKSCHGLN